MRQPKSKLWRAYWRAVLKVSELYGVWMRGASSGALHLGRPRRRLYGPPGPHQRVCPTLMGRLRGAIARAAQLEARIFARSGNEARYIDATEWMERESLHLGDHDPFITPLGAAAWMVPGVDAHGACAGRSYLAP